MAWLALWSLVVVAALIGWSQKRYPQGRLLFPAISAFSVLLAAGLIHLIGGTAWPPARWRRAGAALLTVYSYRLVAPAEPQADLPRDAEGGGAVRTP